MNDRRDQFTYVDCATKIWNFLIIKRESHSNRGECTIFGCHMSSKRVEQFLRRKDCSYEDHSKVTSMSSMYINI